MPSPRNRVSGGRLTVAAPAGAASASTQRRSETPIRTGDVVATNGHNGGVIRRTAAEQLLGEWGVRDVTPDEAHVPDSLDAELVDSPLRGRPLRRRLRNFTPD